MDKILTDSDNALICPTCNSEYMHHIGVEMYSRKEDETNDVAHITLNEQHSHGWKVAFSAAQPNSVDKDMTGNPSSRRTGLVISIICEQCKQIHKLGIAQHKGQTITRWMK